MAKKTSKQQTKPEIPELAATVAREPFDFFAAWQKGGLLIHLLVVAMIAAITWWVLKGCLGNQFTDWDDAGYFVNNPIVRDMSHEGLKRIFSEPVMGNYHPLTMLSYAIEFSYVELEPWLYHFDSLWLHILVTIEIYCFVQLLTKRPVAAAVTALLFGIHPMHVESAVWVAGRKDLLCALFYIAASICYVYYVRVQRSKRWLWYGAVLVLFVGALLSKPVSVTLPVVLLLIDYYEKREWKAVVLLEKIPHFILALIFGMLSVKIQHGGGAMDVQKVPYNFIERIALGSYAFVTYVWKAVLPAHLCCFYPYPQKVNGYLPMVYYLYPLATAALVYALWRFARMNRVVVFGVLFFIVNILLLLQFIPVGESILADRYSYLPYTGLFFIAGWYVSVALTPDMSKALHYAVLALVVAYAGCLGYASSERCNVWYDATTLWTDEIEKEPTRAPIAYNNLGFVYFNKKNTIADPGERKVATDSAIYLLGKAVELKPDMVNALQGLGILLYMRGDFESSATYFRRAIQLQPTADNYTDYANVLMQMGKSDSVLIVYSIAVSLNPDMYGGYLNRARFLKMQGRMDEAARDLDKVISINPNIGEAYYLRSFGYAQKGEKALALQDVDKAISLGYGQVDNNYYQQLKN